MRNVVLAARKKTNATVSVSWLCKSYAKSGRALWGTEADVCRRWPREPLYRAWGVRRDASDTAERVGKARPADRPSPHSPHHATRGTPSSMTAWQRLAAVSTNEHSVDGNLLYDAVRKSRLRRKSRRRSSASSRAPAGIIDWCRLPGPQSLRSPCHCH